MRKQLFGGALLAAGVCASAGAQDFVIGAQGAGNYVGAFLGGSRGFAINGFYDESETSGTASARAAGSASTISAYGNSGDTGVAYTIHFNAIPFNVTADTIATLSWDFTGDGFTGQFIPSLVQLNGTDGTNIFASVGNPVGSVQVPMSAAEDYTIFGTALATVGTSGYSLVIPTPATGALLALGGLVATRRRR